MIVRKVLWDINVQCDNMRKARIPGIILIDREEQNSIIIDIAAPAEVRVRKIERREWLRTRT